MPKKAIGLGMKELLKMSLKEDVKSKDTTKKKKKPIKTKEKELEEKIKKLEKELRKKQSKSLKIDFDKLYKDALNKIKNNEFYESLKLFHLLIYFEPENVKYLNNSAIALYNLGLKEEAIKIMKEILIIEPDNKIIKENLNILLSEE